MPDKIKPTLPSRKILIAVLFVVASAVFLNTLYNGFVYDDESIIVNNGWIRDFSHIPEIFSSTLWGFKLGADSNYYRPLVHLVLLAEYQVFGLAAWAYHLVNVIFHGLNTVLVYLIASHLLERPYGAPQDNDAPYPGSFTAKASLLAFAAALLFAVHPVHVEAVAPASVVAELSLSFFYLASLYLYMRSSRACATVHALLIAASIVFFAVDIFLKETAVTLVAVIIAYDLTADGSLRLNARSVVRSGLRYVPYFLIVLFYMLTRSHFLGGLVPLKQSAYLSTFQYLLNIPPLLSEYIRILFYPAGLNAFYTFHPIFSVGDYDIASLIPLILFIPVFIFLLTRYRSAALFCVLFALLALSPALYIPGVGVRGNAFAERYLYIPSVGFSIVIPVLVYWIIEKAGGPAAFKKKALSFLIIIVVISAVWSVQTFRRNRVWESDYTLWKDTAEKTKDSKVVYINLGSAADSLGHREEAMSAYTKALEIAPYSAELHNNIGIQYLELRRLDDAVAAFKKAYTLTSNFGRLAVIRSNLGDAYMMKGMVDEAVVEYSEALNLDPGNTLLKLKLERAGRLKRKRR
ncbi:MAG: hypothetical protein BMS9Abin23_1008 [Thermodesulfobacteriota bacterium]|nr:MAG: hypothetical protein BMS9Abin23_1008 [Thermodesulfobacteriota bacterium]